MTEQAVSVKKTIETLTGDKIVRTGNLKLRVPESPEEATALYGENLWKWARHGATSYAKVSASNSLIGFAGNKDQKKLRRQFRESLTTLVDVLENSKEDALEMLLAKPMFAPLKEFYAAMKAGNVTSEIDYTATTSANSLPEPRWFTGGEEEEESDDE